MRGFVLGCLLAVIGAQGAAFVLEPAFSGHQFARPVGLVPDPVTPEHWYVLEKEGRIIAATKEKGAWRFETFGDLTDQIASGPSEAGLLGIAFHPDYAANGQLFLSYTGAGGGIFGGPALVSVVSRFRVKKGRLDVESEEQLLTLEQPYANHNGGEIAFGPDGMLYIGFGDGGLGGDPHDNGQNPDSWLGSILRIDPDGGDPYGIPKDNPFAKGGGKPELYAWGLRNPWRFSFDTRTGTLWAGDVGQNAWEEIDRIEKGKNYGWNIKEGSHCYERECCDDPTLSDPVAEYGHEMGCSMTGGYVYRGKAVSSLAGVYLYGDFCSGRIWGFDAANPGKPRLLLESGKQISAFGQGRDGEVFVVDYGSGKVFRLAPEQAR